VPRYERLNVECLDSIRKYGPDVPAFLRSRPRTFVMHCLKRIPPATTVIDSRHIVQNSDSTFTVHSVDSDNTYIVRIYSTMPVAAPACSCFDWDRYHLPCKHMLAVFATYPQYGWDALPEEYRSFPHFHLDPVVCGQGDIPVEHCDVVSSVAAEHVGNAQASVMSGSDMSADGPARDVSTADHCVDATSTAPSAAHASRHTDVPLKLQTRARQLFNMLASATYTVSDESLLQDAIDVAKQLHSRFRAVATVQKKSRFNSRRRFGKMNTRATGLKRRLHVQRRKRTLKRIRHLFRGVCNLLCQFSVHAHCWLVSLTDSIRFLSIVINIHVLNVDLYPLGWLQQYCNVQLVTA